ncbi:zinc finger and SCAN domain-containing protein 12-like isoform X3 [Nilaparvata lugens]|uniref:zinc finger and SCAN domain-containing protein 12-like isoform X3 n=1 Tax=Nilaparvata lugens TaxID=108931 RepID=UPI00193D9570|nr:zinc finger and SCAN domain-containing protein 12-like isoform X3 [Nilaparvata lugens]
MDFKGGEYSYRCHSGSRPVQIQPNNMDGQGQDNSGSMTHSQHQGPDMDICDWPIYGPDEAEDIIEEKYQIQHNMDNQGGEYSYRCHSGSRPVQIQPNKMDGQGQDNSGSMTHSQHQGPDMDICDWPIHGSDEAEDTIEEKHQIQHNMDKQVVYLDHNYSKHRFEIIVLKPEVLIEEEEHQQHEGIVKEEEIQQENDTGIQIESIYSLSTDRLNCDPFIPEHMKVENVEESYETHSETLVDIEDNYSDTIFTNSESIRIPTGLCISNSVRQGGLSSINRSVDETLGNTSINDSDEDLNEVDLLIKNARKIVIDVASDSELTECQLCGEAFSNIRELNLHCRIHTAGKQHKCKYCNYKTKNKANLIKHIRIHTGEKHYSCDFCDYKATEKSSLTKHLRIHTGERPYRCDFCDYKATEKSSLTKHIRIHTGERPYSCDFCDYKAIKKSNLIQHIRIHTGERPYSCDLCDYKATVKSSLTKHLRIHTGERPFSCDFCDYKSIHKSSLNRHLRTHTKERP